MTLDTLTLQNFKRYAEFSLEFEDGLCGILGRNGSGKSTILEGINFALYGDYKGSKELVKTAGTEGNVKVVLDFTVDEKEYRATREFRGKAMTAYANLQEAGENIATGAKEVTAAVTKLLGMGKEAFLHTVFASQKELTALSSMKNDDRKAMMRRLLGLEKIDKIEEMIREELRDLNRDLKAASAYLLDDDTLKQYRDDLKAKKEAAATVDTQVKMLTEEGQKLKTAHEAAKTAVDAQQKAREARQKKIDQLERFKEALAGHEKQFADLEAELKGLQAQHASYTEQLPLKTKLETAEKAVTEQEALKAKFLKKEGLEREQVQLRKEYTDRKEEVAVLTREVAPLEALQKQLVAEKQAYTTLKEGQVKLDEAIGKVSAEIAANRSRIADVQKRVQGITDLGSDSPCPVCTRPLLEQYDAVLAALHNEIGNVYQKQIDAAETQLKPLNEQKESLQKQVSEAETKVSATDKQIVLLQSKQRDLVKARERFKDVETRALATKPRWRNWATSSTTKMSTIRSKLNATRSNRRSMRC